MPVVSPSHIEAWGRRITWAHQFETSLANTVETLSQSGRKKIICDDWHIFSRAAMTKYCRLDGQNYRNLFFHNSRGYIFKIKLLSGMVYSEDSFLGSKVNVFYVLIWPFLCVNVSWGSLYKGSSHIRLGSYPHGLILT